MADKQISDLTSASAMTDGSLFVIEQGGAAKSANWGMVKNYISPGVAAQYSSSAIYNVGDYVIYNGQLYRCITPITTAETWTAAHWTAAVLGDDVGEVKSALNNSAPIGHNYINPGNCLFGKTWGETVGVSTPFNYYDESNTGLCMNLIPVKVGDVLYVGHDYDSDYSSYGLFGVFFWSTDYTFIKRVNSTNTITVTDNGYASVLLFACNSIDDVIKRRYYANLNQLYGFDDMAITNSMLEQTDGYAPVDFTLLNGFYDYDGSFYTSTDYQVAVIPAIPGEEYKITSLVNGPTNWPCAYFFNSQMVGIGSTPRVSETTHFINEVVKIPQNCSYLIVHNWPLGQNTGPARYQLQVLKKSHATVAKPLAGKNVLIFGDSITYEPSRWRDTFFKITGANPILCISYPGAHLTDYPNTVLDGNYNTDADNNIHNTICNQVYYLLTHRESDYADINPDIIIIAAGTNDSSEVDYSEQSDINVYNNVSGWIDVDTINRTTFDGAMRWIHSKLCDAYPNAKIVFCSPIQLAVQFHEDIINITVAKEKKMERVAGKLADLLVKAGTRSGITGEHETAYQPGKYFSDGIHPNAYGGKVLGTFYANEITSMFTTGTVNP